MKSAYIYVRVSTDEQKRRGYSLIEQEQRLLEYCSTNNILVLGIFREDYSAKDFNRPEWKKLITAIKKNKSRPSGNILFLKWDRFSRNIHYAYQMIEILKNLNIQATAIDQPIDFEVPESIVILAIYLSIPQAENSRRGKNTSDGLRRAKKLGRWPGKAPIGYKNITNPDGKKLIIPKQPEADHIKWSFHQIAKGSYSISQVQKMANLNGFRCQKNNFWRVLHNPIYCGVVTVTATKTEDKQYIKGIHKPIISEELFESVQSLLNSKRRQRCRKINSKTYFPLRGFLICPICGHKLTGSTSQGRNAKYRYYHCNIKCKVRFKAEPLEIAYEELLRNIWITPEARELLRLILEDENIFTLKKALQEEKVNLLNQLLNEQEFMSRARRFLIDEKIDIHDFRDIKKEQHEKFNSLNERIMEINDKIQISERNIDNEWEYLESNIQFSYKNLDITGKRTLINLINPALINPAIGIFNSLIIDNALAQIIS